MQEKVQEIIEDLIQDEDQIFLVDLNFDFNAKKHLLEIFIDTDKGVMLDECSKFSKKIAKVIEEEDLFGEDAYVIEVSSPGLTRPLMKLRQYQKAIDKDLEVKYNNDKEEITKIMKLVKVDGDKLSFEINEKKEIINFENIVKATYHLKW